MYTFLFFVLAVVLESTTAQSQQEYRPTSNTIQKPIPVNNFPQGPSLQPSYEEDPSLAYRFNFFDLELLQEYIGTGNVFISPASIKAVLAMILEGTKGNGAREIAQWLRIPLDQKYVRDQLKKLLYDIDDKGDNTLIESSNGLFVSDQFEVNRNYRQILQNFYRGFVKNVDFSNPEKTARQINDYISEATHRLIPELISPESLGPDTNMIVTNALYFKGLWKKSFDEGSTSVRCFHSPSRGCVNVNLMQNDDTYNYKFSGELNAHVVELPYTDDKYSMVIVVPNNKDNLRVLAKDMLHVRFNNLIDKLEPTEILVALPKFDMDYTTDVALALKKLGIEEIFSSKANFSGIINNSNAYISHLVHKTKIEVNEQGTVAAAASGAVFIPLIGNTKPKVIADHPFIFFIYHKQTGNILFEGVLQEPQEVTTAPPVRVTETPAQLQTSRAAQSQQFDPNLSSRFGGPQSQRQPVQQIQQIPQQQQHIYPYQYNPYPQDYRQQ